MRNQSHAIAVLFAGYFLFTTAAFSKDIYVATNGSDGGTGTSGSPYATISKAASTTVAGDSVVIRGGTYNLTAQIAPISGPVSALLFLASFCARSTRSA